MEILTAFSAMFLVGPSRFGERPQGGPLGEKCALWQKLIMLYMSMIHIDLTAGTKFSLIRRLIMSKKGPNSS